MCNNKKYFFMNKEVTIIKIYSIFQLAKIRYLNSDEQFIVALSSLTNKISNIKTLSIKLLGGIDA